jgi:superfamily II DNA or RNA helicase
MSEARCQHSERLEARSYQLEIANEVIENLNQGVENVFISLQQGAGKTIIALLVLCRLLNEGRLDSVLILLPRRVLVSQWVDKAQEMFHGLSFMKNPTISKMSIERIRGFLKYQQATGIAMTAQSFQKHMQRQDFVESDFDFIVVDEAADLVVAKDFIEGFRMSKYLRGLEKWRTRKLLLLPFHVSEKKIRAMVRKFGEKSVLIRRIIKDLPTFQFIVKDPVIIEDTLINDFIGPLEEYHQRIRVNVNRILERYGVEGYREHLETLLNPETIEKLKRIYGMDDEVVEQIETLITKYIFVQHVKKWFLYANREELGRSILASHFKVREWLQHQDRKLSKLSEIVQEYLEKDYKIYIFSQYISTAEIIEKHLKDSLNLKDRDIIVVTGLTEDQYIRLNVFKTVGRILVTTPVFDKGADIPEADVIIVFTPPLTLDRLFQLIGRIRGGEIVFLAYNGIEEEMMKQVVWELRKRLAEVEGERTGLDLFL